MSFELKLNQLAEGIKSIIELIPYYEMKLTEINNLKVQKLSNLVINDDTEIKNNIVLRAMYVCLILIFCFLILVL